ncbi:MAG TPA: branched-chain amino acid ABC transporter permease [Candidatus Sumerlaeota bacterium]|nr:branched-chain amino acid ABC transporter permease [Candidatus Sumerlaeota bacterium]HPS00695.1 branched-chain amino acid ABC transporter permease [Candidatus Sumerlaeota bacterium]
MPDMLERVLQLLVSGLAVGSIYAMVAIGYNIIYNATGIINLAQGEFVMLGGMLTVWGATRWGLPVPVAILTAVCLVTLIGVTLERLTIRPLRNPTVLTLLILTIGGSFLLKGAAMLIWGKNVYYMPAFLGTEPIRFARVAIERQEVFVWVSLAVVTVALTLFFNHTLTGKAMRACSYNRVAARLVGINSRLMVMLAFGLSAGIGALAGAVVVPITNMEYSSGSMFGLKGFSAAVLGGLGNNTAAVVAGIALALIESLVAGFVDSTYKDAVALSVLLIVLFVRPSGLFGNAALNRLKEF